ncbi:caspase family protein [Longimicrobium sp.]|uniref:caspase family protein n=1 Tax=Longimicrobium sp. TaxID=2029185 RepID=UPI003B3A7EAB
MPKGLSIHIAAPVPGKDCEARSTLSGPIHDAKAMARIAIDAGFEVRGMLTEKVSGQMVVDALHAVAGELEAGDVLLLTYSGHGVRRFDETGKEEDDSHDEAWCLDDGLYHDDQLHQALAEVPDGVRVVLISDSCHSGTMAMVPMNLSAAKSRHRRRKHSAAVLAMAREAGFEDLVLANRLPPQVVLRASVLMIAACRDREEAQDRENNGLFTATLVEKWAGGEFDGGYTEFVRQVAAAVSVANTRQHPGMLFFGPAFPGFAEQRPFAIGVEEPVPAT